MRMVAGTGPVVKRKPTLQDTLNAIKGVEHNALQVAQLAQQVNTPPTPVEGGQITHQDRIFANPQRTPQGRASLDNVLKSYQAGTGGNHVLQITGATSGKPPTIGDFQRTLTDAQDAATSLAALRRQFPDADPSFLRSMAALRKSHAFAKPPPGNYQPVQPTAIPGSGAPPEVQAAVAKYGPTIDHIAKQYHLTGAELLLKLSKGENGWGDKGVSGAGARGYTQFIPSTRQEYIQKYGIDPWKDADSAFHATAIYLKNAGNIAAYNPGMPTYTDYILGQDIGGGATPTTLSSGGASPQTLSMPDSSVAPFSGSSSPSPVESAVTPGSIATTAPVGGNLDKLINLFSSATENDPTQGYGVFGNWLPYYGLTPKDFRRTYSLLDLLKA